MDISKAVVLVTGSNRGLGRALLDALKQAGAAKIYAAARNPDSIDVEGVTPIALDVTSAASIAAAAKACPDVNVVINNAGIARGGVLLSDTGEQTAREEMDTNFWGPWRMTQAFAPTLARNGGGALVNVLSVLSWISLPGTATYCVSKAAAWSLTNGLRNELRGQGTQVVGVHLGLMDTDMTAGFDAPKIAPKDVAEQIVRALHDGSEEVLADDTSRQVKGSLSSPQAAYLSAGSE
ncbi:SDR family oxidoreductase [Lysobacter sp. S4-A87]|uniref:SDR family oxidoreductase n=1 Tax=Lysobacter sp. S4-A87 TaxID=2925843 RepID=UPI001F53404B|nr:SDR family oxidoreductase [Lysobacter sp. S4-A87]UNK47994.1 SDR family oxidoreductase [Lysobacter sp. S4-A87]